MCKKARTSRSWSSAQWTSSSVCIMVNGWWRNCCKDCSTVPGWYHNDAGPKCQSVAAVEDSITSHVYSLSLSSRPPPMEAEPPPPLEPWLQPSWGPPPIPCSNAGMQRNPWGPPVMEGEPPPPMEPWPQPSWGPPPISQQSRDAATCAGSATDGGRAAAAYGAVAATVVGSATDGWRAAAADGAAEATVVGPANIGGRAKPLQRAPPTQLVWQRRGLHVRQLREELVRAAAAVEAALAVMEAEI